MCFYLSLTSELQEKRQNKVVFVPCFLEKCQGEPKVVIDSTYISLTRVSLLSGDIERYIKRHSIFREVS